LTAALRVEVPGRPVGQGSLRVVGRRALHPAAVTAWRAVAALAVQRAAAAQGWERTSGPVLVDVTAEIARPAAHYGRGRNAGALRAAAPAHPAARPDLDKIARAVLDAVTDAGTVWHDDAQVVVLVARKRWAAGGPPRTSLVVHVLGGPS